MFSCFCVLVLVAAVVFGVIVIGGAFVVRYLGTMILQVGEEFHC